jgi:glyoxylase-like metal-dependent hydrolase (beta-lactamase superfamily II)
MISETFPVGLLQCNCTILGSTQTREAIVIDPGDDVSEIIGRLKRLGLTAKYIIATHGHIDHVGGFKEIKEETGAPVYLHRGDLFLYQALPMQAALLRINAPPVTGIDGSLEDGDEIGAGEIRLEVHHTPGHTPGSLCFHSPGDEPRLYAGDTLFFGSIGRTDLWGGSFEAIMRSLHNRVMTLPGETVVVPGHGPLTTIERERRYNPFLQRS